MNIYIGGLAKEVTEEDLKLAFEAYGQVTTTSIIKDKFTGESRGFGFVEMPGKKEAENAINSVKELKGRMVTVNEARPRVSNFRSGGGRRDNRSSGGGHRRSGW